VPRSADTDDLEALAGERDELLRTIGALDDEHAAGDLGDDEHATLRAEYVSRTATVLRAIADASPAGGEGAVSGSDPAASHAGPAGGGSSWPARARRVLGRRTVRRSLALGLTVCVAGLVTLLALDLAGVRLPGQQVSGGVTLDAAQQIRLELAQAQVLGSEGQVSEALQLYQQVLAVDPTQPEALTYRGWLVCLTGVASRSPAVVAVGRASIDEAVAADPSYGDGHFFLGLMLLEDYGDRAGAVAQFRLAIAHHVSPTLVVAERAVLERLFVEMQQRVPPQVAKG
jgi:tetratricopeptide (TPR) repeat protein